MPLCFTGGRSDRVTARQLLAQPGLTRTEPVRKLLQSGRAHLVAVLHASRCGPAGPALPMPRPCRAVRHTVSHGGRAGTAACARQHRWRGRGQEGTRSSLRRAGRGAPGTGLGFLLLPREQLPQVCVSIFRISGTREQGVQPGIPFKEKKRLITNGKK